MATRYHFCVNLKTKLALLCPFSKSPFSLKALLMALPNAIESKLIVVVEIYHAGFNRIFSTDNLYFIALDHAP